MAMGEAAATAAAIAIKDNVNVYEVSLKKIKDVLDKNGAITPGKEKSFEDIL